MSARQPRFEICRGDDYDAQPWWARFRAANGRVVWVTENYARRAGATGAVAAIAGGVPTALKSGVTAVFHQGRYVEVREVDER